MSTPYIEQIAIRIWQATGEPEPWLPREDRALWLAYALLALAKGMATTSRDVHDAWSLWATIRYDGHHHSLIPFDDLDPEIQSYDDRYRDAIHRVATELETA